jgi:uncharacterized protein
MMLDLLDYRRRVFSHYAAVRAGADPAAACEQFRRERDALFRTHSQSALDDEQKATFVGLPYYDYDPAFRVVANIDTNVEPFTLETELDADGLFQYRRFATVAFTLPTGASTLSLFWIAAYGGGLFLPFGDTTCGKTTYGGGRYLFDTIKGADIGTNADTGEIVLDFNFAYNPSCAYNPRWVCPLTPIENRLPFAVTAGEKYRPF